MTPAGANPTVSVIMPAHNTAPFIGTAVRSALGQTFSDIEIILCDDGSTDDTVGEAERAAAGDPRLIVLRQTPARGPSAARNAAMAAARGRFFAFLDSDDEWLPTFLERQLKAFDAWPDASIVNGNAVCVGGPLDGRLYRPLHSPRVVPLLMMIEQEDTLCIMSVMRRSVFDRLGGFDTRLLRNEDYEFWIRAAVAGHMFVQTPEPLVRYRRRESGLSADELRMLEGVITVFTRARYWCADRPRERQAIDRQIARFEREALMLRAKSALRERRFSEARRHFRSLQARYPRWSHTAMAVASLVAPRGLWLVDRIRRAVAMKAALVGTVAGLLLLHSASGTAATVRVPAGADLQLALSNARPGDVILLEARATFTGNFTLPNKQGSAFIVVRSDVPEVSGLVTPDRASGFARIRSTNSSPAISTESGAHHWRLELLDISGRGGGNVVSLGDGSAAQDTPAKVPHDLVIDRSYIHGDAATGVKRCIALNSASTTISNSYVSDCKWPGQDAQAIAGWNGPGPFTIAGNYLEGSGENVLFGGADPEIPGLVPSDIVIRDNHIAKPVAWRTERWQVKNLLELKNARRVTIAGNLLEYNWEAAQSGFAVLFTVRNQDGRCPWCQVEEVSFVGNTLRHVASGIEILGYDDEHPSRQTRGITIRDNVFVDVNPKIWGGSGYAFLLLGEPRDIVIDHNTIIQENAAGVLQVDGPPILGFELTNNIATEGEYGVIGTDHAPGNDSLSAFFPAALVVRNVIAGGDPRRYPAGNFFPSRGEFTAQFQSYETGNYALAAGSLWLGAGTDGRDLGAPAVKRPRQPPDDDAKPRPRIPEQQAAGAR